MIFAIAERLLLRVPSLILLWVERLFLYCLLSPFAMSPLGVQILFFTSLDRIKPGIGTIIVKNVIGIGSSIGVLASIVICIITVKERKLFDGSTGTHQTRNESRANEGLRVRFALACMAFAVATGVMRYYVQETFSCHSAQGIETQKLGEQIIVEIERFREEHGRYPRELHELENERFHITPPEYGHSLQWDYERKNDGNDFALSFYGGTPSIQCRFWSGCDCWKENTQWR